MRAGKWWFAAVVTLAACSSGSGGSSRPNPVTLIDKASGCVLDHGGPSGEPGLTGFLVADCTYATQESLTVKTFTSDSARDDDIGAGGNPDGIIVGPRWVVYVTAAAGQSPDPAVADIAKQLGGAVR